MLKFDYFETRKICEFFYRFRYYSDIRIKIHLGCAVNREVAVSSPALGAKQTISNLL